MWPEITVKDVNLEPEEKVANRPEVTVPFF
jgi:hypothetical protein